MNSCLVETPQPIALPQRGQSRHRRACMLALWGLLVIVGYAYVTHYSSTAGVGDAAPSKWPADSGVARIADKPTLVMFIHPACPCSRATLREFARIMTRVGDQLTAHVIFIRPDGMKPGWERTGLWDTASAVPGAQVSTDIGGIEARRFGAATSGYTVVYDTEDHLVFQGGITFSRGHEGDSKGKLAVLSWMQSGRNEAEKSPVFGCPLRDPDDAKHMKD